MTIRWGILGCGDVTEVKSGPGFQKAEGSVLTAVMRRNGALAEDYARRHNVPKWYDDADALIHDPDVDAVYIATPPGSHLDYALRVCAAGKPAYVEKPMARSHAECQQMVEAFAAARVPLFVAFYRRALPRFLKAKEIAESGCLGTLSSVSYQFANPAYATVDPQNLPWRVQAEQAGGGLFLDLGCHTLDILDFILGPLEQVSGSAANIASAHDVEDSVAMAFRTASGAIGTAQWNFAAPPLVRSTAIVGISSPVREDRIEILGTRGYLALSTFGNEPVMLETEAGVETFDLPNPAHIQQPFIQTLVDELHGKRTCASTGVSGARTSHVMDTVLTSYYGSREDAFWTRPESWPGRRFSGL